MASFLRENIHWFLCDVLTTLFTLLEGEQKLGVIFNSIWEKIHMKKMINFGRKLTYFKIFLDFVWFQNLFPKKNQNLFTPKSKKSKKKSSSVGKIKQKSDFQNSTLSIVIYSPVDVGATGFRVKMCWIFRLNIASYSWYSRCKRLENAKEIWHVAISVRVFIMIHFHGTVSSWVIFCRRRMISALLSSVQCALCSPYLSLIRWA